MDFWRQLSLHSQVSFKSLAICYNSSFKQQSVLVKNIFESYNDEDELEEEEENRGYFLKTEQIEYCVHVQCKMYLILSSMIKTILNVTRTPQALLQ